MALTVNLPDGQSIPLPNTDLTADEVKELMEQAGYPVAGTTVTKVGNTVTFERPRGGDKG